MIGVIADTNIYISALEFGGIPLQFLNQARAGVFRLDVSAALLHEVERVLRDKFGWQPDGLADAFARIARFTSLVLPTLCICVVADDPDDDRILECAVAAGSAYIVTGDRHLLRLGTYGSISIVKVAEFMTRLPTL